MGQFSDSIRLPAGVRDFLPRAAARRRSIANRLQAEFESWGFQPIITPLFECADVLERGLGDDARSAAIRFIEPATGEVVALRPDITPQLARIVATRMRDLKGPIRLCYEGAVTRIGEGARGQREVLQAGVELINAEGPVADAELVTLAAASLGLAHLGARTLDVGHVALARIGLARVEDPGRRQQLERALLQKDRNGVAEAAKGLPTAHRTLLETLPVLFGAPSRVFKRARELALPASARKAIAALEETLAHAMAMGASEHVDELTVDLGELRGFDYYTGMRLAGFVSGAGAAVLRGGRYDELIGRYGLDSSATGFAVDIEALAEAEALCSTELHAERARAGVLIVPASTFRVQANKIARALRLAGLRVAVDVGNKRARQQIEDYARQIDLPAVFYVDESGGRLVTVDGAHELSRTMVQRIMRGQSEAFLQLLAMRSS